MPYTRPQRIPRLKNPAEADTKIQQALSVLAQRGVKNDSCPRCGNLDWNVDLVEIPARSALLYVAFPALAPETEDGFISLLTVVCRNCGNTLFHNLEILGINVRE
jgi:predicted nucleic-acid-binding Zn-ribbon protein